MNFLNVEVRDVRDGRAIVANAGLTPVEVRLRGAQPAQGARARLGVRPQNLTVLEDVTLLPGAGLLRGKVEISERLGSETIVDVVLPDHSRIVAALPRDAVFLPGQDVTLTFRPEQAHLFVR